MLNILTIVGARPQIIKAAALSRCIKNHFADRVKESILHTGQHYDDNMSRTFFEELQIPLPAFQLQIDHSNPSRQMADMIKGIDEVLQTRKWDLVILYGDTNSTFAGAFAAAKAKIPIAHIEAGLRSYDKNMPEELNRIYADQCAHFLFAPTQTAIDNLQREAFEYDPAKKISINNPSLFLSGDIMYDNALYFAEMAEKQRKKTISKPYLLATIHRDFNTDNAYRLNQIMQALQELAEKEIHVLFPMHPRTEKCLKNLPDFIPHQNIEICPPLGYLDMLYLEKNADFILTDSGGVQKEAYFFEKKCIIVRPDTEWTEIVKHGSAMLAQADKNHIVECFHILKNKNFSHFPNYFGEGNAAEKIIAHILMNNTL